MVLTREILDDALIKRFGVDSTELGFDDEMIECAWLGFTDVMRIR